LICWIQYVQKPSAALALNTAVQGWASLQIAIGAGFADKEKEQADKDAAAQPVNN